MRAALLALAVLAAVPAVAQSSERLSATVTQIAGADAYLGAGRDDGLAAGDTLRVWREGVPLGRMVVVGVASASAVVTPLDAAFPLTRGDRLELEAERSADPPAVVAEVPVAAAEPVRTSILEAPAPTAARTAPAVRLGGRLQLGADALTSTTTFQDVATDRRFSTPFASLRATLDGGGWRAEVDARASARLADGAALAGASDVRVYQAALRTTLGGAEVRAGRFVPERERFSGAWDGADVRLGDARRGLGVVGGLRPDGIAGAPGGGRPGGFAYAYLDRPGAVRLTTSASAGAILDDTPDVGGVRPFIGAAGRLRATPGGRAVTLAVDALGDVRPDAGAGLARFSARATLQPARAVTLRATARSYRASALDGLPAGFDAFRSRSVGAGATLTHGGVALRGDVSRRASGDGPASTALAAGVSAARLPGVPLGADASATVWRRDGQTVRYLAATLSAPVRSARLGVGWRRSESPAGDATLVSQGVGASAYVPLTERLALRLRADLDGGGGLSRSRLYSALWVRL